jgi:uncharacterized DUF497 family protein
MKIEFDPAKSEKNRRGRGLPFELVKQFDWESAVFWQDMRFDYPETRYVALGLLGNRVHVVCVTPVSDGLRIISFRKANDREVRKYEKEKAADR